MLPELTELTDADLKGLGAPLAIRCRANQLAPSTESPAPVESTVDDRRHVTIVFAICSCCAPQGTNTSTPRASQPTNGSSRPSNRLLKYR